MDTNNLGRAAGRMRRLLLAALAAATPAAAGTAAAAAPAAGTGPKVIYGLDHRQEVLGLPEPAAAAADATVALVDAARLAGNGDGTSRLLAAPLAGLCPGERFAAQPSAALCSGALVAPDVVATAGHCVAGTDDLAGKRFVFGFRLTGPTTVRTTFADGEVYRGVQVLARQESPLGGDYALVRLDRRVVGHAPLRLAAGGPPPVGTPLYVVGHPLGLPAKIAGGAVVLRTGAPFFAANLDTYAGNSGSPVFDARTSAVLGLLSRGSTDLVQRGSCLASNVLPDAAGGELVTNAGAFAPFVPRR